MNPLLPSSKPRVLAVLLLLADAAEAAAIKPYVLTGQSNSRGTSNGAETDQSPGLEPADAEVKFWWKNRAGAGVPIGNCANRVTPLLVQQGGHYAGSPPVLSSRPPSFRAVF